MHAVFASVRDASEATLPPLTEEQFAGWLTARGQKTVRHQGRYWLRVHPGFYSALHPLARMTAAEASRPCRACWGYRCALREEDRQQANGSMPLHMLADVTDYTWQNLSPRHRNKLRNLRRQARIVELCEPELLSRQGYGILRSAHARNRYGRVPGPAAYRQMIRCYYDGGHCLVLGGLIDGHLGGYLTSYAIGTTAYIDDLFLHSDYLRTNISLGLFYEWVQICRRSGFIREIVHGLHAREAPGLCRYKEELGLAIVQMPVRVWFAPGTESAVRILRPHAYYRLTGHD